MKEYSVSLPRGQLSHSNEYAEFLRATIQPVLTNNCPACGQLSFQNAERKPVRKSNRSCRQRSRHYEGFLLDTVWFGFVSEHGTERAEHADDLFA